MCVGDIEGKAAHCAGGQEAQWREEGGWRPLACQVGTQLILKHCTSGLGQEAQKQILTKVLQKLKYH